MTDFNLSDIPLEQWELDRLIPYEKNNKKHDKKSVEELAKSIAEHGVENPILIEEDGTIISGHGRREALLLLGHIYAHVRVARGMSKAAARKLRLAANKTVSTAYDSAAIAFELDDLQSLGIDLDGMGFTEREFQSLMTDVGEIDVETLTDDIQTAVVEHEETVSKVASEAEDSEMPVAKVFGFKKVPVRHVRTITRFLGVIEEKHGEEGLDALVNHMEEVLKAA